MKKHTLTALLSALMLPLASCGTLQTAKAVDLMEAGKITASPDVSDTEPTDAFLMQQTDFALRLTNACAAQSLGKNLLVSPYSVMQALAMTANGADGDTRREMEQVLSGGIGELTSEQRNQMLCSLRSAFSSHQNTKLKTANSIWIRDSETFSVEPDFLQTNADYFGAGAFRAPFDQSTLTEINAWVKKNTDGMIPELLDSIHVNTMMYLINAVAFDARWKKGYEKEQIDKSGRFVAADGTEQTAVMLSSEESVFLSGPQMRGFLKPYQEGFSFAAMLPDAGVSPENWLSGLYTSQLMEILMQAESCTVRAQLPEFTCDYGQELSDTLKAMGMPSAFSNSADFTAISKQTDLLIGAVEHKTHITLDAEGTKAAAATSVEMRTKNAAAPPQRVEEVILDRPFVYMIIDDQTSLPVFIGILNSLS